MNVPISYKWLASHFEKQIPSPEEISRLFMLHLCEVEGVEKKGDDTIFDLKILPDRGHDLLAHKGIAHEVSVLSGVPLKDLTFSIDSGVSESVPMLRVLVEDQKLCPRYVGRVVEGITVGESPAWIRERLESVGQRSINNIVDITNFVMLELGQPMHAFDAGKITPAKDGALEIVIRPGIEGEQMTTLDNKEVALTSNTLVVADSAHVLAVAGVKGGKRAQVDEKTTSIILESANFDAVNTRRTGARIGIRTDSSKRFEHGLSPALAEEAMAMATALILEVCPGAKVGGVRDVAVRPTKSYKVGISLSELNGILGSTLSEQEVKDILSRLGFSYTIIAHPQEEILAMAQGLTGKPYKFGASVLYDAPETFDCSSLLAYLYKEVGVAIPRMVVDQFVFAEEVSASEMKPGDLVFSNTGIGDIWYASKEWMPGTEIPGGVDHVGLFLGEGKVLHASRHVGEGSVIVGYAESEQFKTVMGIRRMSIKDEPRFVVTIPDVRLDLRIKEDLAEEIGRVYGFHNIKSAPLPTLTFKATPLKAYYYGNMIRDALVRGGFSEVFTYSFQNEGVFGVENPIADDKGFLRKDLATGMNTALVFNARNAPLLALENIELFEIGKVFPAVMEEKRSCALGVELTKGGKKKDAQTRERLETGKSIIEEALGVKTEGVFTGNVFEFDLDRVLESLPEPKIGEVFTSTDVRYAKLSPYPFVLRDIALWVPETVTSDSVLEVITKEAGELLRTKRLFDVFTKEFPEGKKTSYAFNLVFQSYERTLSDDEINTVMTRVTDALTTLGYTVR